MSKFIYRVSSSLTETRWEVMVKQSPYKEGVKVYLVELGSKRVKKEKLLKPDTMALPRTGFYTYFTYCFEEDIGLAKDILKDTILAAHAANAEAMRLASLQVEAGPKDEPMREWKGSEHLM